MAKKKRKKSAGPTEADCDLTPMIDVTFLLLIFFILNLKFKVEEGEIESFLPKDKGQASGTPQIDLNDVRLKILWYDAGGAPIPQKDEETDGNVILKIGRNAYNGPNEINNENMADHPIWQTLFQDLENFANNYKGGGKNGLPVIIDARSQVPYRYVARALNEVVRAGVKDVTFAAPEKAY
jgi:biopolymer transport protein ExbD